jgi:hypothetical protein
LSPDRVRKVTVEAVLTVPHVVVDTGVKASLNVSFVTLLWIFALVDREILLAAVPIDHLELVLEMLVLQEFFVEHWNICKI